MSSDTELACIDVRLKRYAKILKGERAGELVSSFDNP